MAMSMQVQALLANPAGAFADGASKMSPLGFNPQMGKRVNYGVKCIAEEKTNGEPKLDSGLPKSNPSVSSPTPTPPPRPQPKKVSTNFRDVFAFSGPAPERINGRLAMIGFVAAVAVELSQGTDLFSQISDGSGAQWFLGTSILLSAASLVPLFKGKRAEERTSGLMNANVELWNGRVAMLGLVALAFTEFVTGGALV